MRFSEGLRAAAFWATVALTGPAIFVIATLYLFLHFVKFGPRAGRGGSGLNGG